MVFCACSTTVTNTIKAEYVAAEGGHISGESTQSVQVEQGLSHTFSQVSAVANKGYTFAGWDDGCTEASRTDTLSESKTFTALFNKIPPIVAEYIATPGGSIIGKATQEVVSENGQAVSFEMVIAKPDDGYIFLGWSDGSTELARKDTLSESKTFTAVFKLDTSVSINYYTSEGGYIEGNDEQINEDGAFTSTQIKAVAKEGYRFTGWDDGVTTPERSDFAEKSKTFVAYFIKVHNITFSCNTMCGTIEGDLSQTLDDGLPITPIVATAEFGYKFLGWSNGIKDSTLNMRANSSGNIEAIFVPEGLSVPALSINTVDYTDITSREEYLDCFVSLTNYENEFEDISARIRGRGNSSWEYDKRPYKLKFDTRVDMFGNGAAKDWTLIANHCDLSLSRNYLAQSVASLFDSINCTTSVQFVELYLNYEYIGVYLLCEQIEVQETRVNIDDDLSKVDTGYLFEMDARGDGYTFFAGQKCYVIKSPDTDDPTFTTEHKNFIRDYVNSCLTAVNSDDYTLVTELMDVESFAEAYVVFELFNCVDVGYSSFFMYKDAGGKLCAGPVWDFDRSLGIVGHSSGAKNYDTLWAKEQNPWFNALLTHEGFVELVSQKILQYKDAILEKLDECYTYLYANRDSFDRNFVRWEILGTFVWPNDDELTALDTWDAQVEYTREYLKNSLNYLLSIYG
ncbi:MAG: CotH kinase family protein [Clostridia bacterium]|nr:CotH kinase family protein [Clostridia bacterium]